MNRLLLVLLLSLLSCTMHRNFERQAIPLYSRRVNPIYIDSYGFPDSVIIHFIVAGLCSPNSGKLTEEVNNNSFDIPFSLQAMQSSIKRTLWIVDDWSASLQNHSILVDSLIKLMTNAITETEELNFIRFARDYRLVLRSNGGGIILSSRSQFANMDFFPDPNGTDFLHPLEFIFQNADTARGNLIFLFSDGDFGYDFPTDSVIQLLDEKDIKLYSIGIGPCKEDFLSSFASSAGGFYLHWTDSLPPEDIASLIYYGSLSSYRLVYKPVHKLYDGLRHQVSFSSACGSFQLGYNAPFAYNVSLIAKKNVPMKPFIIPFIKLASTSPSVWGEFVLDSLISSIVSLPSSSALIVKIDGYTCSVGSEKYNIELSRKRARKIEAELKRKFGKRKNIEYVVNWHGRESPLYSNEDEWGRELNRRVEVRLLLKPNSE